MKPSSKYSMKYSQSLHRRGTNLVDRDLLLLRPAKEADVAISRSPARWRDQQKGSNI